MDDSQIEIENFLDNDLSVKNLISIESSKHLEPNKDTTTYTQSILIDDFKPQPHQGDSVYYFNRLGGDRGGLGDTSLAFTYDVATATIQADSWGGMWTSLNHTNQENLPLNFSSVLPSPIQDSYQSQITGLSIKINEATPDSTFIVQLRNQTSLNWTKAVTVSGEQETLFYDLPPISDTTHLLWSLENAQMGDYVVVDEISMLATTQISDTVEQAFVWSYGMLLNNWDPQSGLVRDRANYASGTLDSVQATGSLAAATAVAQDLGVISRNDAIQIVSQISNTLLITLPKYHGLWPHFTSVSPTNSITITPGTEWSSIDTAIAAVGLLEAQQALGLDTSGTIAHLKSIHWDNLYTPHGISHGYSYDGILLPATWDTFGGESWLINLVYAASTSNIPNLKYPAPPTANGSGFIDELSWLFFPPPCGLDTWDVSWNYYRQNAINSQVEFICKNHPLSCSCENNLFGLSAAEVPIPSQVPIDDIYQPFGVGGQFSPPNDGAQFYEVPILVPHYAAMIASNSPQEATSLWQWLISNNLFSPLNNVESFVLKKNISSCENVNMDWNSLKGSWNLSLQTLGWGKWLTKRNGEESILWQAMQSNNFLNEGYDRLADNCSYLPIIHAHPQNIPR